MDKKEIKDQYSHKISLIKRYNKHYYDNDNSIVTDQEFDLLKIDIINLEKKFKFLKSEHSPTKTVGFKPSKNFQKVKHKVPMLSLGNAFNEEDLQNF